MASPKLKKFERPETLENTVIKTVNIERRQAEWIDKQKINFSALVREYLDKLMKEDK